MSASPERCFAVVTDFEQYPGWARDVKEVDVTERDMQGRGTAVSFHAAAFGRSARYSLCYDYSKAPQEISWTQSHGDLTRRIEGSYQFDPAGDGETEVVYTLDVELKVPVPGFVKRRAEERIIHAALGELKARAEAS